MYIRAYLIFLKLIWGYLSVFRAGLSWLQVIWAHVSWFEHKFGLIWVSYKLIWVYSSEFEHILADFSVFEHFWADLSIFQADLIHLSVFQADLILSGMISAYFKLLLLLTHANYYSWFSYPFRFYRSYGLITVFYSPYMYYIIYNLILRCLLL